MLTIKQKGLLLNIIKHCERIIEKTNGLTREQLDTNEDALEIICFNILQIGELVKNFEKEFIAEFNKVPWRQIKGMRDKVAHGYGTLDKDKIWSVAKKDIKPLFDYCNSILQEND